MATLTRATALVVFVAGLAAVPSAFAQSQADFDACHQMAATKVQGSVSASPGSSSVTSAPGTSTSSSARVGGGGVSSSTSASGPTGTGTLTAASASGSDALKNDPTYQQAFRDCLKARGF